MNYNKTYDEVFKKAMELFKNNAVKLFCINVEIIVAV
jgi:hypothetical protein